MNLNQVCPAERLLIMPGNRHIPRYHSQNNHGKSHESPSGVKFESMELPSQRAAQPSSVSKVDPPKPNMNEKQHPEGDGGECITKSCLQMMNLRFVQLWHKLGPCYNRLLN